MIPRPDVPLNTQRRLWAEAIGHCMNPKCQAELIENNIYIGDMAHIHPHAEGGDVSFDNLILLCSTCHRQTGANMTDTAASMLREWKRNRNSEIETRFAKRLSSFKDLEESVTPLFRRNGQIFDDYGPNDESQGGERHKLWLRFEGEIISNNRRLELILTKNRSLLPKENQKIVDRFVAHTHEFLATRDDKQILRVCLFPREVLSIFGLAEAPVGFPPNLSALQNFITCLVDTNRFVALELNEAPCVTYLNRGENVTLMLEDRPQVQQIFWNGSFFRPKTTDVRIENLVFFAQWLYRNNIHYEFNDVCNLTELTLNREHRVKICYKYVLSLADVHTMTLREGDMVVNLHNWNAAPVSDDARKYAP